VIGEKYFSQLFWRLFFSPGFLPVRSRVYQSNCCRFDSGFPRIAKVKTTLLYALALMQAMPNIF
jgi:hypothetical protein